MKLNELYYNVQINWEMAFSCHSNVHKEIARSLYHDYKSLGGKKVHRGIERMDGNDNN